MPRSIFLFSPANKTSVLLKYISIPAEQGVPLRGCRMFKLGNREVNEILIAKERGGEK